MASVAEERLAGVRLDPRLKGRKGSRHALRPFHWEANRKALSPRSLPCKDTLYLGREGKGLVVEDVSAAPGRQ